MATISPLILVRPTAEPSGLLGACEEGWRGKGGGSRTDDGERESVGKTVGSCSATMGAVYDMNKHFIYFFTSYTAQ